MDTVPADHPLYGFDVDGLLQSDAAWMQSEFLSFYTESTRRSMQAKFARFQDFCDAEGLAALPTRPSTVYRYIRFLRAEGKVGVRSLPQYLAAISMVHQVSGCLHFSAFDRVTKLLTRSWRRQCPEPAASHAPAPASLMIKILDVGLHTEDLFLLRAAVSATVDYIFFNRAQSGHLIFLDDLRVADGAVIFRERRTKLKPDSDPAVRLRTWPSRGAPEVVDMLLRWGAMRDRAWAEAGRPPAHFFTLPGERDPSARTVSSWFTRLLASSPALHPSAFDHHGLRAGGASACFALEVPEQRIRHWGDWRSAAIWRYIDVYRIPSEWDYRLFGWMTITARDLHERYGHIFCS